MAGCILVDFDKLQVINRSPAYKNHYVHRRGSTSLATLSDSEIAKRVRLGLVTDDVASGDEIIEGEEEDEEWQDLDEQADDVMQNSYVFAAERRPSIDLNSVHEPGDSMSSINLNNDSDGSLTYSGDSSLISNLDFESNTRHRSRKPRVSAIFEESEDAVIEDADEDETVNGDESFLSEC
jgi:hypothetical protein